jgi:hypothetical protein
MADAITMTFEGSKELKVKLLAMSAVGNLQVLGPIVEAAAGDVADLAAELAPRLTGALKGGVIIEPEKSGVGYCWWKVKLRSNVWYGMFQEFGLGTGRTSTRPLTAKTRKSHERYARRLQAAGGLRAGMKNRYGEPHNMRAQPFLRPAVRFLRRSLPERMLAQIAAKIAQLAGVDLGVR